MDEADVDRETWNQVKMLLFQRDYVGITNLLEQNHNLQKSHFAFLLFDAMRENQLDLFKVLLNPPNTAILPLRNKLLLELCESNKTNGNMLEELIRFGVDLNQRDEDGRTPLHKAARADNVEIVKCLLEHGCDLNARTDGSGEAILHYSIVRSGCNIVECLVSSGCSVNERSRSGDGPLHVAVTVGRLDAIQLICEDGRVDLSLLNRKGQDAMSYAFELEMWYIWDYLIDINAHKLSMLQNRTVLELVSSLPWPKCSKMIKDLFYYGYNTSRDAWIWNDHAKVFIGKDGADKRACVRKCSLEVRTLKALSCITIRNAIGMCVPSKYETLPIPNRLKWVIKNCQF